MNPLRCHVMLADGYASLSNTAKDYDTFQLVTRASGPASDLSGLLRLAGRDGIEVVVGRRFRLSRLSEQDLGYHNVDLTPKRRGPFRLRKDCFQNP